MVHFADAAPVLKENIDRPLRYTPQGKRFVIVNGSEFFNRPLYGSNSPFRVDAGDKPEFSLYLRGRGGNLRLGVKTEQGARWLHDCERIESHYIPGAMMYRIRDPLLGDGEIKLDVIPMHETEGLLVRAARSGGGAVELIWAFGGSTGARGARDGDIGTEREPVSQYFQLKPEYCEGNVAKIQNDASTFSLTSRAATIIGLCPPNSKISISSAAEWNDLSKLIESAPNDQRPIVVSRATLSADAPVMLALQRVPTRSEELPPATNPSTRPAPAPKLLPQYQFAELQSVFDGAMKRREEIASWITVDTPDPYINAAVAAVCIAADGTWDGSDNAIMHGAVAWRMKLLGWRGAYWCDALGQHAKLRQHLGNFIPKQNIDPIPALLPKAEESANLSRNETALHTNGAMSFGHYDMNLVAIDALFRHIMWTGDLDYAREVWPAIERHLAWERRLFRRPFGNEGGADEPLYEAYAAFWASDDVGYNGGGTTVGSAYNYLHNRMAARLAEKLGVNGSKYDREADLICAAMNNHLWLADRGWFAEWKDLLGLGLVHADPALWSFYHAMDSETMDEKRAWQMSRFIDTQLPRIPVRGPNVPAGEWFTLPTTTWMPHAWSTNNVVMAEASHGALAYFQAGRSDVAFQLFKGCVLDSMFLGLCPGNAGMCTALDMLRGERQRDFSDAAGIVSRTIVEGLFGIRPDALSGELTIAPGFPSEWERASIKHPTVAFSYERDGEIERFTTNQNFAQPLKVKLVVPARRVGVKAIRGAGNELTWKCRESAVGKPFIEISAPTRAAQTIEIEWQGEVPAGNGSPIALKANEPFTAVFDADVVAVDDPQHAARELKFEGKRVNGIATGTVGHRTVFAQLKSGAMTWWSPIQFEITALPNPNDQTAVVDWDVRIDSSKVEHVDLKTTFNDRVTQIFKNEYLSPRSPYCSLAVPRHGFSTWCKPTATFEVDDSGLRVTAAKNGGKIALPNDVTLATPGEADAKNILFMSRWDNYPAEAEVALSDSGSQLYLLMTGSTSPMLSRFDNAEVIVTYADGSTQRLPLHNPTTWWPIDQDYCIDDFAFARPEPLPARVDLKTGDVRVLDMATFKAKGKKIDGGAATVLVMNLDKSKQLRSLKVRTIANEVVVGLMAVTVVRN